MLTKEYRIPLPMTLEEYRIAQLYMIQKKSRLESTGSGSAVEIIENTPYENGPGGNGQYTKKIYHVGSHLPGWLKSLLPKTAMCIEEEAWNAYPYTKTRYTCPFIEKFFIDIETHYLDDYGQTENVFKLTLSERRNIEIDLIDPIKDSFPAKDYKKEEDPHHFVSEKTGRGPLQHNWLNQYKNGDIQQPIMCAYKLIRVEFKYWGMQSKIEQFIQNGLRNPMLVGHRQAWSWQDEWYGLTMDNIRELERQAQLELSKRMGQLNGETSSSCSDTEIVPKNDNGNEKEGSNKSPELSDNYQTEMLVRKKRSSISQENNAIEIHMKHIEQSDDDDDDQDLMFYDALETLDFEQSRAYSVTSADTVSGLFAKEEDDNVSSANIGSCNTLTDVNTKTLIFVVQGGNVCDTSLDLESRRKDFQTFENVFTSACNSCYPGSRSNISFELIQCPSVSCEIYEYLKQLNTLSPKATSSTTNINDHCTNNFPFSSIPLLISQAANFQPIVDDMVTQINEKYKQFIANYKNDGIHTSVYILADCLGTLLVYEVLCDNENTDTISIASDNTSGVSPDVSHDSEPFADEVGSTSFDFVVNGLFSFGSPIGLLALQRKLHTGRVPLHPQCGQLYNLFHPFDPMSSRLEPVIDKSFGKIKPAPVPRCQAFPYNNDIQYNYSLLYDPQTSIDSDPTNPSRLCPNNDRKISAPSKNKPYLSLWWGTKRIDYSLHCPDGLQQFPVSSLLHLCYNSYWESKDLVTFILWQILAESCFTSKQKVSPNFDNLSTLIPKEKWIKKRTNLKIKNLYPNHRANDIISVQGSQPFITGKFSYGPVDMAALTGEKVDVYIASRPQLTDWKHLGTDITDSHGRFVYHSTTEELESGVYSVQMVVRGDHSHIDCNMAIVPPKTEAVVFSIDGSFLASYSLRGVDPKIRGGAVDIVRHWQELGYLIIYVSSRLIHQKEQVMSWLSQHNFPFGIVSFCENISTDFHKHKIEFLKSLTKNEHIVIHAAYGSSRDIPVYVTELKLAPKNIFLIGKKVKSKKADAAQWITEGYVSHLKDLKTTSTLSNSSTTNKSMFLTLGNFGKLNANKQYSKKKISKSREIKR